MTVVLGINAYHSSASAALLVDGELVAAAEEERFTRVKYEVRFPQEAIAYCLAEAGLEPGDVDHLAIAGDPLANLIRKAWFVMATRTGRRMARHRADLPALMRAKEAWAERLGVAPGTLRARVHRVEHHIAHMASAFYASPFDRAAVLSLDGFGDMVSTMWGVGEGTRMRVLGEVNFPHSLGIFYLALTQFLGFHKYGDEYKVMGLSSYGEPEYLDEMRDVLRHDGGLGFSLDMGFFRHGREMEPMNWREGSPRMGRMWGDRMVRRLGPARGADEPLEDRHRNLAASMQRRLEEVVLSILRSLHDGTGLDAVALAGGVALNSVVNGKIRAQTGFRDVFVQPAAYDGGTSLGAAYQVHHSLGLPRTAPMEHAYYGPGFDEPACRRALESAGVAYRRLDDEELVARTAEALDRGAVVGWFQGRMEWGPRALGNRSILVDPRRPEMKDVLNSRIKHREPFRPFAPSILEEATGRYFEDDHPSPFMLMVYNVRKEKRDEIPSPTHVDGTGRLQTVRPSQNPRYHALIGAFEARTGVPVVLNTSFNENEPICCTPTEAVETFRRTRMDVLVLENLYAERDGPRA
ncbi:MAG: carbamoyltransferase [Actinobacteria bacterium]|nr:carbamoyltransferase [Actinomycetota bacterium]